LRRNIFKGLFYFRFVTALRAVDNSVDKITKPVRKLADRAGGASNARFGLARKRFYINDLI